MSHVHVRCDGDTITYVMGAPGEKLIAQFGEIMKWFTKQVV
jgi:hypothetical protein